MQRYILTIFLLVCIMAFPYFVYLPILGALIIYEDFYIEGIGCGFLIDILYGEPLRHAWLYPWGFSAALLVVMMIPLRKQLRFNA